ncbi:MAG: RdgB/HAM1 family non-canonical purine NTP pyrophosphatase [Pseudomonadota bacterium]
MSSEFDRSLGTRSGSFPLAKVVLASGNRGKLAELGAMLKPLGLTVTSLADFGLEGPEEPAETFVENALIKARHAALHTGLAAIADDSGIAVDALDGAPGVRSARYAGEHGNDGANVERVLAELAARPGAARRASFHACVVLLRHPTDPAPLICHGRWDGVILDAPRGTGGFGYDPVFGVPERQMRSAAELSSDDKNRLSHRGKAMTALIAELAALRAVEQPDT